MRGYYKLIVAIIALQAGCLALGLWIHGRYVASSVSWTVCEEDASSLQSPGRKAAKFIGDLSRRYPAEEKFVREVQRQSRNLRNLLPDSHYGLILLDPDDNVLTAIDEEGNVTAAEWKPGSTISFRSLQSTGRTKSRRKDRRGTSSVGTLLRRAGKTAALSLPLPNDRSLLIYHNDRVLVSDFSDAWQTIPETSLLSFLWIGGLQSMVVVLIGLRIRQIQQRSQQQANQLSQKRLNDLVRTRDAVIFGLAKLAESRDPETGQHLERIAFFSMALSSELRRHPAFSEIITPSFIRNIGISSALHDIGKVGIEDEILLKPGRYTPEEHGRMQAHTIIGGECIRKIEERLGGANFLQMAREIALYHHEHWNGKGYPYGLSGEQIPLEARIVAVADVYDALSVKRIYKEALPHEECVAIITEQSGKQFDPIIVSAFLRVEKQFRQIARRFSDRRAETSDSRRFAVACQRDSRLSRMEEEFLLSVLEDSSQAEEALSEKPSKPPQVPVTTSA